MRRRQTSEREQLDLFRALPGDLAPRDAQDLMAYPFFSLAKSKRTVPIDFRAGKIAARRIPFIRVCQPSPVDLNASKTSESTRRLMASFLVSDFGRPLGRIPNETVAPATWVSVSSGASSYSSGRMT